MKRTTFIHKSLSTERGLSFKPQIFSRRGLKSAVPLGKQDSNNHLPKYNENPFTHKKYAVYVFDDDSVCNKSREKAKKTPLKKDYI